MGWFGQLAASSQFFLYGKKHFTRTGWEAARKAYAQPDILESPDLSLLNRVYIVTGANSGIGKEVATFLAKKKATVYLVCRNAERAEAARAEIMKASSNDLVHVLLADCSEEDSIRSCWQQFVQHSQSAGRSPPQLHGLICNAGALWNEFTANKIGIEITLATHLLFGTYLLTSLAMGTLATTPDSRVVVVSSGGMYNTRFPDWNTVLCRKGKYSGNLAYSYAKRGQVLLCEEWAKAAEAAGPDHVKFVSCHPGWTSTPGVDSAFGDKQKYLEPLRSVWEGAEGIAWLCCVPRTQLEGGAFYLDRKPQRKHLAGAFFTEGSFTRNSPAEIASLVAHCQRWSCATTRPAWDLSVGATSPLNRPLEPLARPVDVQGAFMGRWYVWSVIPTTFDRNTTDNVENYQWNEASKTVAVSFTCRNKSGKLNETLQTASMANDWNSKWNLKVKLAGLWVPVPLPYLVAYVDDASQHCIIGVPSRAHVWIMGRVPPPSAPREKLLELTDKAEELGFSLEALVQPEWTGKSAE